jgi:hypothetical protein
MSSVKPLSDTMAAICALVHQQMTASSTRWLLRIGTELPHLHYRIVHVRCRAVTTADYPALEKVSESAIKDKQKFERLVVPKETLLEMFAVRVISFVVSILWVYSQCSIINIKNTLSKRRYPTAHPPLYTDVVPW